MACWETGNLQLAGSSDWEVMFKKTSECPGSDLGSGQAASTLLTMEQRLNQAAGGPSLLSGPLSEGLGGGDRLVCLF